MGAGLHIDTDGHNIAFTGGTGILVFLDLVAMLLLDACISTDHENKESKVKMSQVETLTPCQKRVGASKIFRSTFLKVSIT